MNRTVRILTEEKAHLVCITGRCDRCGEVMELTPFDFGLPGGKTCVACRRVFDMRYTLAWLLAAYQDIDIDEVLMYVQDVRAELEFEEDFFNQD